MKKQNKVDSQIVFVIGEALRDEIDTNNGSIFGTKFEFQSCIRFARKALRFYSFQIACYRRAVDIWTVIAIRNNVVKDMRRFLANMIWEARREAQYKTEQEIE